MLLDASGEVVGRTGALGVEPELLPSRLIGDSSVLGGDRYWRASMRTRAAGPPAGCAPCIDPDRSARRHRSPRRAAMDVRAAAAAGLPAPVPGGALLRETAESVGRPELARQVPDALAIEDPVMLVPGRALGDAVTAGAEPMYADSVALALALHVVHGRLLLKGASAAPPPVSGALSAAALDEVHRLHARAARAHRQPR